MNFKFLLWKSNVPLEDDAAYDVYRSLLRSGTGDGVELAPELQQAAAKLKQVWPTRWWATPLRAEANYLLVTIKPDWLWDVWPAVDRVAKEFELVYYDPQQYNVLLPRRLSAARSRLRKKFKRPKRTTAAKRRKRLSMSKYPPRVFRKPIPERIPIRREKGFHSDVAGVYRDGQFFGVTLFLGTNQRRPASVLHRFNAAGEHVGSDSWKTSTIAEAEAALTAAVAGLPQSKRRNIAITPFQIKLGGQLFGLIPRADGESLEYRPYGMIFKSPWDGTYDT